LKWDKYYYSHLSIDGVPEICPFINLLYLSTMLSERPKLIVKTNDYVLSAANLTSLPNQVNPVTDHTDHFLLHTVSSDVYCLVFAIELADVEGVTRVVLFPSDYVLPVSAATKTEKLVHIKPK
jgi:hypothetical protein